MPKKDKEIYDAVIIGAGISGLVCGCYLAKAGMKVLIAEQHNKPGGYCTSFKRQGFTFDAAAHSFGGYRSGGIVRKVFKDLALDKLLKIKRFDPSDIIITPEYIVSFWADIEKTIEVFQIAFPDERDNISKFLYFLTSSDPKSFSSIRSWTFKKLLDHFFINDKLKAIISFPVFGNAGLPPSLISAFSGVKIYTEFLLDGGYYTEGGIHMLSDILAKRFVEFGGELLLSCTVNKINLKENKVSGVTLKRYHISARYVISNCDARQTYFKLIGKNLICKDFSKKLNNIIPSLSMFVLYLGIDKYLKTFPKPGTNVWFLPHYSIENMYLSAKNRNANNLAEYMVRVSPNKKTILSYVNASFKNKKYWASNKEKLAKSLVSRIEKYTLPNLSKHIVYVGAATPYTLFRYTLNYKGAAYGWASLPSQLAIPDFKKPSFIEGLYLTGHWTTQAHGIPGVTYLGHDTAKLILRKEKLRT